MITLHEKFDAGFTPVMKGLIMNRGALKTYLSRAESIGATACDMIAEKKGVFFEVTFSALGIDKPGHYHLVLGPQGRVVSKDSCYPQA